MVDNGGYVVRNTRTKKCTLGSIKGDCNDQRTILEIHWLLFFLANSALVALYLQLSVFQ